MKGEIRKVKKKLLIILLVAVLLLAAAPKILADDIDDPFQADTPSEPDETTAEDTVSVVGSIVQVNPATIPCVNIANFEDVAAGNYNGILVSGGLQFAERFVGQVLSYSGDFDVLS